MLFLLVMSAWSVFFIVIMHITWVFWWFKSRVDHTRSLIIKLLLLAHLELLRHQITLWRLVLLSKAKQIHDHKDNGADDYDKQADDHQHYDLVQLLTFFQICIVWFDFGAKLSDLLTFYLLNNLDKALCVRSRVVHCIINFWSIILILSIVGVTYS